MPGTHTQRLSALERANAVRLARAELKRQVGSLPGPDSTRRLADLILDPPEEMLSAAMGDVMFWGRRWGRSRVRKFLVRNQISETKPAGSLTERQRRLLAGQLRGIYGVPNGEEGAQNPTTNGGTMESEDRTEQAGQDQPPQEVGADQVQGDQVAGDKIERGAEADQRAGVVPDRK